LFVIYEPFCKIRTEYNLEGYCVSKEIIMHNPVDIQGETQGSLPQSVHVLLVGINVYQGNTAPTLNGCVNDVQAIQNFLKYRLPQDGFQIRPPVILTNQAATRGAIIQGLQDLAKSVGPKDIALFYYSGHGSQEPVPPELAQLEPDGYNETLVCHDSRSVGGYDLADKELSYLLDQISSRCKHLLVILDCCHSGSGTRAIEPVDADVRTRLAPKHEIKRPFSSYVFAEDKTFGSRDTAGIGGSGWIQGSHVRCSRPCNRSTWI
jgi:uncharacterized caspase-like protein